MHRYPCEMPDLFIEYICEYKVTNISNMRHYLLLLLLKEVGSARLREKRKENMFIQIKKI